MHLGIHYVVSFLVCNQLAEEESAGGFTLIVFLLSCYMSLSRGAMGWSVVCD